MKAEDFNVIQQNNGLFVVEPKKKLDFNEFKEVLAIMKSHGGFYSKGARFLFKEDPTWLNEQAEELKAEKTEEVKALIEATTKDYKEANGVEFEVHKAATYEECFAHINELAKQFGVDKQFLVYNAILKKCEDEPELVNLIKEAHLLADHARMLQILSERCKEDEELRANLLHKDYGKMVVDGGKIAYQKLKDKNHTALTADDIAEYVIAEYKKIEVKPAPAKKAEKPKKSTEKNESKRRGRPKKSEVKA